MRNYDVLFDRTDKEIHFTKADCDKHKDDFFSNIDSEKLLHQEKSKEENYTSEERKELNLTQEEHKTGKNAELTPPIEIKEKYDSQQIEQSPAESQQNFNDSFGFMTENNKSNKTSSIENERIENFNRSNLTQNFTASQKDAPKSNLSSNFANKSRDYQKFLPLDNGTNSTNSSSLSISSQSNGSISGNELLNSKIFLIIFVASDHHLVISISIIGMIFVLGLVAFIVIKIKKIDVTKK